MKSLFNSNFSHYKGVSGIYMIIVSNHTYVGSSKDLNYRFRSHVSRLKRGDHINTFLQNCYNKHGKDSFHIIILEKCKTDILLVREQYYLDTLDPDINIVRDIVGNIPPVGKRAGEKEVYQYTLNGDFVEKYISASEAARLTNISSGAIARVCRPDHHLKSVGGFLWFYELQKEKPIYTNSSSSSRSKTIIRNDGKIFKSIADAARDILQEGDKHSSVCAAISNVLCNRLLNYRGYTYTYL